MEISTGRQATYLGEMKMKSKRVVDLSEFATPEEREAIEYDVGVLERLRQMPTADRRDMMIAETESSLGLLVSEIRSRVPKGEPTKKNGCIHITP